MIIIFEHKPANQHKHCMITERGIEKKAVKIFKKIMFANFLHWGGAISVNIQELKYLPSQINLKWPTTWFIINQTFKNKETTCPI